MFKEMLKWLLLVACILGLTFGIFRCSNDVDNSSPSQNLYSEKLLAEMPNGCHLFNYKIQLAGNRYYEQGRYILCGNGAQTSDTHQCGKNCTSETSVIGDPVAIKRALAYSKLTEEERKLLGVK